MPLKETLDQPETLWVQFRHRLDKLQPFCRIAGHTSAEVQEILATLEMVCRETFPQLNLRQWSEAIYSWLTHPLLDPTGSSQVVMGHLMKLVTTALEWSYEAGETEVSAETLQAAAELLTLGRDTIRLIDGAGQRSKSLDQTPQNKRVCKRQEQEKHQQKTPPTNEPLTTMQWERRREQCHPQIARSQDRFNWKRLVGWNRRWKSCNAQHAAR